MVARIKLLQELAAEILRTAVKPLLQQQMDGEDMRIAGR